MKTVNSLSTLTREVVGKNFEMGRFIFILLNLNTKSGCKISQNKGENNTLKGRGMVGFEIIINIFGIYFKVEVFNSMEYKELV